MAGSAIVEQLSTLYSSDSANAKKKLTLFCTTDGTTGDIAIALSTGVVSHLAGYYLYRVTAFPGSVDTTDNCDLTIVATSNKLITLAFDAGLEDSAFVTGETVTGGTSGATGILTTTPILTSGAWDSGNDAAGNLTLRNWNGTAFSNDEVLTSTSGSATSNGTPPYTVLKSIDILGGDGANIIDATTTKEIIPALIHKDINFYPVIDPENTYTVTMSENIVASADFVLELLLTQ